MINPIRYILILLLVTGFAGLTAQVPNSDMVEVKSGSFTMGNASFPRESTTRTVNLSTFYMSKYTITNAQYAAFVNQYGSVTVKDGEFAGKPLFVSDSWGIVNNGGIWAAATGFTSHPMVKVTWYGANEFCKFYGGRLPTEAEWEYAAKGGPSIQAFTYSGSNTAATVAWFYDNSGHTNKPVGTKVANTLGIFDMSGNVYQWCSDWFGRYSEFGKPGDLNPKGPEQGASKVIRGGYRSLGSGDLRLTSRESISPDESYNFVGFRMVKDDLTSSVATGNDLLQVFPNPASSHLNISSSEDVSKVEITDCQGRMLYHSQSANNSISLNGFPNGMYIVRVVTGSKEMMKKIVVKN